MELFSLFREKIRLHSQKYHLISKLDRFGMNRAYLKELRLLLRKERDVNKRLKQEIDFLSRFVNLRLIGEQIDNINKTTDMQLEILNRVELGIFRQLNYKRLKDECKREIEQSKFFLNILKETATELKGVEIPKREFEEEKILVSQAQKTYSELVKAIGNVRKVEQKAKELVFIGHKLKRTKLYEFMKQDIDFIISQASYAMKHPKESKLKFILASAYIISPGTFELTGVYLIFRYINKYIKLKSSRAKSAS